MLPVMLGGAAELVRRSVNNPKARVTQAAFLHLLKTRLRVALRRMGPGQERF